MRYRLMGRSGLRVSEVSLGTMTFGKDWGFGSDKSMCQQVYSKFRNVGGNFIDTANYYTGGTSETLLGEMMQGHRDEVVLATKYSLTMNRNDINGSGNHRKNMVRSIEASLKRLQTDYIDLFWLHVWDFMTPIDELMRGLDDLVRSGKVLYIGISDTPAWVVSRAQMLAELRGWSPFIGLQVEYSLAERTVERELLPMARELDLGVTAWGPLAGGILSGKYTAANPEPKRYGERGITQAERHAAIIHEVQRIAIEMGRPPAQIALNWLRQQPGVIIPILGARTLEQLSTNIACINFELSLEQMARLDHVSRIELGFPHEFYTRDYVRDSLFGPFEDQLINHRKQSHHQ